MSKAYRAIISGLIVLVVSAFFSGLTPATAKPDEIRQRVFIHYPKPNHDGTNCQVTTDATRTTYGLPGWHMSAAGWNYRVNYSTIPSSLGGNINTILDRATGTWNSADQDKDFNRLGSTGVSRARYDGTNLVAWGRVSGGAIAVTYVWYYVASGQLAEADVIMNKRLAWSWNPAAAECALVHSYDAQNILTHELGHVAGLDDLYDPADRDLTMYGYGALGETKKNTLGEGDKLGANAVAP